MVRSLTRRVFALALLVLLVLPLGCAREPAPPSNVLLITVDTLRPDALGFVSGSTHTPVIDQLAREGFAFPGAVSHVPLTLPSHTSMMTGLFPFRHGVHDNGQLVGPALHTLAEQFRERGYHTAAFVSGFPLRASFGLDAGFDHYDDHLPEGAEGWVERRAMDTTAAVLAHLKDRPGPWFIWVHYYDPHDPYDPPADYVLPGPRGRYDGEVAYTDAAIGSLREGLAATATHTITLLTADHGEGLGEHQEFGHGTFIYDSTMKVPLILHAPGRIAAGHSDLPARLVDIAPTLLALLDQPAWTQIDGIDLSPVLRGESLTIPPAYIESRQAWITYGWAPLTGLRDAAWKYIQAPRAELYALVPDPHESTNLAEQNAPRADDWSAQLEELLQLPRTASATTDDPALLEKLRSLGYIGAGRSETEVPADAADPKDRIAERDMLLVAEAHLRAGRHTEAVTEFDAVLQRDPGNRFATLRAGIALLKAGELSAAVPRLQAAVALDPEQAETRYALADALSRTGQHPAAIEQWLETVRLQPRRAAAWANLGTLLAQGGQYPKAREALGRAFELEPANADILANLGALDQALGTSAQTLALLQQQVEVDPQGFAHPAALGLLLLASDPAAATPWLRLAQRNEPGYAEARWQLCLIEAYAGRADAARTALQEAAAANPRYLEAARAQAITRGLLPSARSGP